MIGGRLSASRSASATCWRTTRSRIAGSTSKTPSARSCSPKRPSTPTGCRSSSPQDSEPLVAPDPAELAERVGLQTHEELAYYDLVVVGAGPAGLAAAVYGASEGLRTVVVERQSFGGQAGMSSRIENYLGFPAGLSGADLARRATTQARRFGSELLTAQEAVGVDVVGGTRVVRLADGTSIASHTVLLAPGSRTGG